MDEERQARFEGLFRSEADLVRAYALRRADPTVADDVVAETFLVAWRRLDDVPEAPRSWLLGVARRVLANRRRGDDRSAHLVAALEEQEVRRDRQSVAGSVDLRLTMACGPYDRTQALRDGTIKPEASS